MGLGLSQVCAQLLPGLLVVPSLVGQVCMVCVCVHMPVMPVCAQLSVHLDRPEPSPSHSSFFL